MLEDDNKTKTKVLSMHENNIFSFIYNVKTTDSGKFPYLSVCNINIFQLRTKIAVKL